MTGFLSEGSRCFGANIVCLVGHVRSRSEGEEIPIMRRRVQL